MTRPLPISPQPQNINTKPITNLKSELKDARSNISYVDPTSPFYLVPNVKTIDNHLEDELIKEFQNKSELLKLRNLPTLDEILEQKDFESGTYNDLLINY